MSDVTITDAPPAPPKNDNSKTLKIVIGVAVGLIVLCFCLLVIGGLIYWIVVSSGPVTVAVYDHMDSSDISYFTGGITNSWDEYESLLLEDPDERFEVTVVTDLSTETLKDFDRLVLPDNAVPDIYLTSVADWLKGGSRSLIAVDSAITYVDYSGLMWEGSAHESGEGTFWNYGSSGDDLRMLETGLTEDIFTSALLSSYSGDAQMIANMLPADAVTLARSDAYPENVYAACREIPGGGTLVVLGPFEVPETDVYPLIRNLVHASACK